MLHFGCPLQEGERKQALALAPVRSRRAGRLGDAIPVLSPTLGKRAMPALTARKGTRDSRTSGSRWHCKEGRGYDLAAALHPISIFPQLILHSSWLC